MNSHQKPHLALIGAADSIGVPYTKDNIHHQGFFELITQHLSQQYTVLPINCFHMSTNNDNPYITKLIDEHISLATIKNTQNQMLKKCKYSGIYPYLELPKSFLNHYQATPQDENIVVRNIIQEYETIFIYSAFVNDLLKSHHLSLFKLLQPQRIKQELTHLNLEPTFNHLEKNLQKLITLNPAIKVYIIGLFVPTKLPYVRNHLTSFITQVNSTLAKISQNYSNVHFINNSNLTTHDFNNIDFHPNYQGHQKIYQNFLKLL